MSIKLTPKNIIKEFNVPKLILSKECKRKKPIKDWDKKLSKIIFSNQKLISHDYHKQNTQKSLRKKPSINKKVNSIMSIKEIKELNKNYHFEIGFKVISLHKGNKLIKNLKLVEISLVKNNKKS